MSPSGIDYGKAETDKSTVDPHSLDMVRKIILDKHNTALDDEDPLLIQHTMHLVFIGDLQKVVDAFCARMEGILEETGTSTAEHVRACLDVLKDETLDSSLKQTLARVAQEASGTASVKASLLRLRNTTFIMVAMSWVALFLNFLILVRS